MKSQFPFTDYDFWAYISAGFVFLFALDHVADTNFMVRGSWTVVEGLFATACAYMVGHLLAGIASAVLERRLVRRWLGSPTKVLLGEEVGPRWFHRLYPSYYEPLPAETNKAIMRRANSRGVESIGEALFWLAFDSSKANKSALDRMSGFQNQYSMCRNLALTGLLSAAMLCGSAWWFERPDDYKWAAAAAFLGTGMLLRYLKFYRHFAMEVFTTYAHSKDLPE